MIHVDRALALTFRRELVAPVATALRGGESCSLVGISGMGKSNLVQFLRRSDVQAQYFGDRPSWLIPIDTHGLVFDPQLPQEFVVAELMIHRLIREAEQHLISADTIAEMAQLHTILVTQPSALLALRYLERICGKLIEGHGIRLIFMFDQFEDIWARCEPRLFLNLRALRDEFKYQLAYLVMTRNRLPLVRERSSQDSAAVEAFWELFSSHCYGIGAYSPQDAEDMLRRIDRRSSGPLKPTSQEIALSASGRHPGLLRAIYWVLHAQDTQTISPSALIQQPTIWSECQKIWNDLSEDEQELLYHISNGERVSSRADGPLAELYIRGVLVGQPLTIFAPVFAEFVRRQRVLEEAGISLDPDSRQVWRDGILIAERLTPLEFTLLEYLVQNAGRICSRDELMQALYGEEMYNRNDERLETVLRRLRKSLNDSSYIVTERGVGVRLTKGKILRLG